MCQQKEYSGNENENDGLPIFIRIISNDRIFALMKDQEGRTGYDLYVPVKENEDISTLSTEEYEIIKGYTKEECKVFLDNGEWEGLGFWDLCHKYGY